MNLEKQKEVIAVSVVVVQKSKEENKIVLIEDAAMSENGKIIVSEKSITIE